MTSNGTSTTTAQLTVSDGAVQGQGQLTTALDMQLHGAACHGESDPVPFTVSGTQDASGLHLGLQPAAASVTIAVTCDNGISLPFPMPLTPSTAPPFDIAAQDGATVDLNDSNQFLTIPPGFSGQTHVVVTQA